MRDIDVALNELAARQLGLVTREELGAAGMSVRQIERRLATGALHSVHRRVYRLASWLPSREQELMAACLAGGPATVASHRSAARLWRLRGIDDAPIEVTVPGRRRRVPGALVHFTTGFHRVDVSTRNSVPVTSAARTLCDLPAVVPGHAVERALDDASLLGLVNYSWMCRTYDRLRPGRPHLAALGKLLSMRDPGSRPTASELESMLLEIFRAGGLPEPVRQYPVGRFALDFAYPAKKLGIEGDSARFHSAADDLRRNAFKRNYVLGQGWRLLYFTWWDRTRPSYIVSTVLRELDLPAAQAPARRRL